MRLNVDVEIPDFPDADKRTLFIFAGITCVAVKPAGESWRVKTGHCKMCGGCCSKFKKDRLFPPVVNGVCQFLEEKGEHTRCVLGINRPFNCAIADSPAEGCSVKYVEVQTLNG